MIAIPTVGEIRDQIITCIESRIGQTTPIAPKAFFRVLATAIAGVLSLFYRFSSWGYAQIFPQTADDASLAKIGELYLLTRKPAVAAILTATISGDNGVIVATGTLWSYGAVVFSQNEAIEISGGTGVITVTAVVAGSGGNVENGAKISLVTPLAGVARDAIVASSPTIGEDIEALDDYRARVITRIRTRPQGGATPDYISWGLEVAGIVKVFAFRTATSEVTVYPLQSTTENRVPDAGKLSEVLLYLTDTVRRPLCANVLVAPMTEKILDVTVSLISPDTVAVREAVENSLNNYLLRAYPIQYPDEVNPTNTISLAALYGEATAAGALVISMTMRLAGAGADIVNYQLSDSEIIRLGVLTWPT